MADKARPHVSQPAESGTRASDETSTDWTASDRMSIEERHAAAVADPDAQPITEETWQKMRPVPRVRTLRRALGLSQEDFAGQFQIPIGTLRDWEQGRSTPDQAARSFLRVIAAAPDVVRRALSGEHLPMVGRGRHIDAGQPEAALKQLQEADHIERAP